MGKVTLSICIPAYKRPIDLKKCIESIVQQPTFAEKWIELIICDDSPSHPVTNVVRAFQKKYGVNKIKYYLNKVNLGFEKNILLCIEKANNSYLYFLTDDDLLTPDALAKIKKLLWKHPDIDFFSSTYLTQHEDGTVYGDYKIYTKSQYISAKLQSAALFFGTCNDLSGKCFRKKHFSITGYSRHFGGMYPHLYSFGELILTKKTYYEAAPLFIQTIGNYTYWTYPVDYCIKAKFEIIDDLGKFSAQFVELAKKTILLNCPYMLYLSLSKPRRAYAFIKFLAGYGLLFSPINWWYFAVGASRIVKEKVIKPNAALT